MHCQTSWLVHSFPSPHSTAAGRVADPVEKPCRVDLYPGRELGTRCPTTPHHANGVDLVEWYGSYKFREEIRLPALFRRRSKQIARRIRELSFQIKQTIGDNHS